MNRKLIRRLIVLAVLLVVVAVIPSLVSAPWLVILVQVLIISIATLALTVLAGYGGQFSIASAGLFATGAGVLGWLINTVQLPTPLALLGAILGGALVGLLVGLPALRLRGLYLMLSTLAANFILIFLFSKYASNFGEYGLTFAPLEFFGAAGRDRHPMVLPVERRCNPRWDLRDQLEGDRIRKEPASDKTE